MSFLHVETEAGELLAACGAFHSLAHTLAAKHARDRGATVIIRDTERGGRYVVATYRKPRAPMKRRKACDCPASCHGASATQHAITCRPARPRCRWRRRAEGLCHCPAYHYPHRDRSGRCVSRDGGERFETYLQTTRRRVA